LQAHSEAKGASLTVGAISHLLLPVYITAGLIGLHAEYVVFLASSLVLRQNSSFLFRGYMAFPRGMLTTWQTDNLAKLKLNQTGCEGFLPASPHTSPPLPILEPIPQFHIRVFLSVHDQNNIKKLPSFTWFVILRLVVSSSVFGSNFCLVLFWGEILKIFKKYDFLETFQFFCEMWR